MGVSNLLGFIQASGGWGSRMTSSDTGKSVSSLCTHRFLFPEAGRMGSVSEGRCCCSSFSCPPMECSSWRADRPPCLTSVCPQCAGTSFPERGLNWCWWFKEHTGGFRCLGSKLPGEESQLHRVCTRQGQVRGRFFKKKRPTYCHPINNGRV